MTEDEMIELLWQASKAGHTIREDWLDEFVRHPDGKERIRELLAEADTPTLSAVAELLHEFADAPRRNASIRAHVAGFIGLLNSLALETGAAIILISHPNKAGDSFSGSTAFQNQVRSHFHLEVDANDPDARTLKLMKANYARLVAVEWLRTGLDLIEHQVMAGGPVR